MNEQLHHRFSIAVSFGNILPGDYIRVLKKYKYYIHDVYFSPTESLRFQTRKHIYDFNATSNTDRRLMLQEVLSFAHDNGIKCCMTLNAPMASVQEQVDLFASYTLFTHIDSVTTTLDVAKQIRQQGFDAPLTCSYNEAITDISHLHRVLDHNIFSSIVIGGRFLRACEIFDLIKSRGVNTVLMLNTGCCFDCVSFCKSPNQDYCSNLFKKNLYRLGIDFMYAQQSVFPEEIQKYYLPLGTIDVFKLASRPITAEELDRLLQSYCTFDSKSFVEESNMNYHLYGRLAHFMPFYGALNYHTISDIKERIWAMNS